MTTHQRIALACRTTALAAVGATVWMATRHEWALFGALAWGAFMLAFIGGRCQKAHLVDKVRHERARRAAHTDQAALSLPAPCCSFWKHSSGKVHGANCPLPPAARYFRDGRPLDERETAAFDAMTASLDLPGPDPRTTA
jgi:hypothetical protein